jgi:hypothetical protein
LNRPAGGQRQEQQFHGSHNHEEKTMTHTVKNVADLLLMFHRNERPIYFISATNFNLLGMDRWVNRFRYISYIDCFDGRHPNVFVPAGVAARRVRPRSRTSTTTCCSTRT